MCGTKGDLLSFTVIPCSCFGSQKLLFGGTDSVREQQAGCELGGASWTDVRLSDQLTAAFWFGHAVGVVLWLREQAQQKTGIVFWLCEYQMGQDTFCARHRAGPPAFCARDD